MSGQHTSAAGPPLGANSAPRGAAQRRQPQAWGDHTRLSGRTLFITGGSRGIGLAIALRAARDGANVVIAAKTAEPNPKLPGHDLQRRRGDRAAGGQALPVPCDIRDEDAVAAAVDAAVERFGGIDILVNNASAISLTGTLATPMKRFDLMFGVNVRGTYRCSQACLPHLLSRAAAAIRTSSTCRRRSTMDAHWFAPHVAYTMAKYGMSMCVLGMAEEFAAQGIARQRAVAAHASIATAALQMIPGARDASNRAASRRSWPTPRTRYSRGDARGDQRQLLHRRGGAARSRRDRLRALRDEAGHAAHARPFRLTLYASSSRGTAVLGGAMLPSTSRGARLMLISGGARLPSTSLRTRFPSASRGGTLPSTSPPRIGPRC